MDLIPLTEARERIPGRPSLRWLSEEARLACTGVLSV